MAGRAITKLGRLLFGLTFIGGAGTAFADQLNMTQGVTKISHEVYHLHMLVLWIVTIVGIGVFGVIIYSLINHRKSKGAVAAQFHENTTIEVIWTAIPLIVLVAIAVPATKTLLQMEDASHADLSIKITGMQWRWKYDYLDSGISFVSSLDAESRKASALDSGINPRTVPHYLRNVDHPLVLPIHEKIRFLVTSQDVIHSWFVPAFAVKKDAIPGYVNETWTKIDKPGIYRGQCAELCGKGHAFMPIVVKAVTQPEFAKWVAAQKVAMAQEQAEAGRKMTMAEQMSKGKELFDNNCAACHQVTGLGIPGVFPALKGSKIATGPIAGHLEIVIHGSKKNPAMQAWGKTLNDVQLSAIITYERNAWGNNTGDVIQPSQVKAAR